jgi:hypothetical protein
MAKRRLETILKITRIYLKFVSWVLSIWILLAILLELSVKQDVKSYCLYEGTPEADNFWVIKIDWCLLDVWLFLHDFVIGGALLFVVLVLPVIVIHYILLYYQRKTI